VSRPYGKPETEVGHGLIPPKDGLEELEESKLLALDLPREGQAGGRCQSKFVYFAKTSEPDFAAIDFPEFLPVDLSGSMAVPSI
jgi:hypothetical protein